MKITKASILTLVLFLLSTTFASAYSQEEQAAYEYAYQNQITTMDSIEKANMWWNLTRIAMAKMLSNYAINILWLAPNTSKICYFPDVSNALDTQYDNWVTKACQLGLMWVWITNFNPNWLVTRAEFWTVLSRALNAGDIGMLNTLNSAKPYYSEHLKFLKREGIMNNISTPSNLERRWRVMLMLLRAEGSTLAIEWPHIVITDKNENYSINIDDDRTIYRNEAYGIQIDFRSIWKWSKIQKRTRWEISWIENSPFDHTMLDITKNGNSIARISMYTYEEYERILELSKDEPMCDQQCFKNSIIGHNNEYYFGLWTSNMSHEELKALIPALQCSENNDWTICNWWIDQMFPDWSFSFFDVKIKDHNNKPVYSIYPDSDNRIYMVWQSGVLFESNVHGIKTDLGSIWSWAIIQPWTKKISFKINHTEIASIDVYTYEEYEYQFMIDSAEEDNTCEECFCEECFRNSIIWHNNKYYFSLITWNIAPEELKTLIPALQCSESNDWINCDWWVEQLFPTWCFKFFDIE